LKAIAVIHETLSDRGMHQCPALRLPAEEIEDEVGRVLASKHPEMAVQISSFQGLIRDGLACDRLMALLWGFFGLLAAVLAAVGLYGVIAYPWRSVGTKLGSASLSVPTAAR
jgi:hypothetical protein